MTATDLAPLSRQQLAAEGRTQPGKITGKLRIALDAMVWDGLKRADAAQRAGLTEHGLYVALTRPHVRAYYLKQLDVLRTSERARNIHALVEVRDQQTNQMARVGAVKALEQLEDEQHQRVNGTAHALPGLVVVINAPSPHMGHKRETDANPLIEHAPVSQADDDPHGQP